MKQGWYLLIDCTSSKKIKILSDGGEGIAEFAQAKGEGRVELVEELAKLLKKAKVSLEDLQSIIVNEGPGSYTGLKLAASVANTLSYALDKPKYIYKGSFQKEYLKNPPKILSPLQILKPDYGGEPHINRKRQASKSSKNS